MSTYLTTAPPQNPTRVFDLASLGASREDIAADLGIPVDELDNLYSSELKKGAASGRERALQTIRDLAIEERQTTALIFWIKAQCGWRDTGSSQSLNLERVLYEFTEQNNLKGEPTSDPAE